MNQPIKLPVRPISQALQDLINEHNSRVALIWMHVGSNCKPFKPSSPSTVPAALQSRVPAVEHGGSIQDVRS